MSWSSSRTTPEMRAIGTSSCIRLRQRMKVDLPQPEGPMIAVTRFSSTGIEIERSTVLSPKPAVRFSTTIFGTMSLVGRFTRVMSVAPLVLAAQHDGHGVEQEQDDHQDHDRRRRVLEEGLLRHRDPVEDLDRQRRVLRAHVRREGDE